MVCCVPRWVRGAPAVATPMGGRPRGLVPGALWWWVLLLLGPQLFLLQDVRAQIGLNEEREELLREADCARECKAVSQVAVCGTNGKTYDNLCRLQRDACKGNNVKVKVKHEGECSVTEMCPDDRRVMQDAAARGDRVFVPRCNPDGTYAPVQCHEYSGFCWCARLDGQVIRDTILEGHQPDCSEAIAKNPAPGPEQGKSSSSRGKEITELQYQVLYQSPPPQSLPTLLPKKPPRKSRKHKKRHPKGRTTASSASKSSSRRCEGKRLKEFKDSFIKHVKKEFVRDNKKASKKKSDGKRLLKEALRWKFKQLDKNKDNLVRRTEYKGLRRLVRKQLKPRKCAKQFPNFCDIDANNKLEENEWVNCFMPSQSTTINPQCCKCKVGQPCKCKAGTMCHDQPKREKVVSCEKERAAAFEMSTNSAFYKPTCTPNGLFEAMQCYDSTGYCWCVDVKTGQSLEGTTVEVKYGKPDCNKPLPHAKEWPGCETERKERFMLDFQSYLNRTIADITMSKAKRENQKIEDFAANQFFTELDRNKNGFLEKKEKKNIRKKLQKDRKLKKCAKKLSMYCDFDNDKKISQEEWLACAIMPKTTEDPIPSQRKHSENPFETILRAEE